MAEERSGTTDPARTLALLWREPTTGRPSRGPRQGLTVDAVVDTGIALADGAGLEALTMRRVAQSLGVAPMSLYTYVRGKAELLDLMLDAVYLAMPRPDHGDRSWRERVTTVAEDNRALLTRHPWVTAASTTRPVLGPGQMAKYEHELLAFEGIGLTDVEMDAALTYLLGFVHNVARLAVDREVAARDSAMNDEQWWAANGPLLAKVLDPSRFPTATRVGTAAGEEHQAAADPDHAYEFGLRRVLDGFAALLADR
ncbi:AcrR family transcriptional regulator [Actinoalloteichus hoggarensis]|uniref:Tetracycline repressor protein class E n=1 Tax=Actinoalloteichus hoggarensis TaxID=1470176 RepID=A0A221W5V9_9PSEU|nr:TetR/AcrR family transcriptional regulator C-terminal domain-containing protein [Actinoalloteichus hoggarensis]ASO21228.1 Tetracycline repressor protein class E [Actinoalloteichus hoggarensis]MBB5921158.1 AcrR family transcriptional regulator [Actinoalloteichus hoggarensis]